MSAPDPGSLSDDIFHKARGHLNSIQMNVELGRIHLENDEPRASLEEIFDVIATRCLACAEKLTELEEIVSDANEG